MIKKGLIPVLAAGHGINDLLAGYFLGTIARENTNIAHAGIALLLYNLLAFGGQYPVALWMEKHTNRKPFLTASYTINIAATALFLLSPSLSVVVVMFGVASAIYHVAGGAVCAGSNKATPIGVFAAPGVAGLIAGGYIAWAGYQLTPLLLLTAVFFLVILFLLKIPASTRTTDPGRFTRPSIIPDRHDVIMALLLTVIALRSAVWNIFQFIHEENYEWLFAIAAAAFTGKIAGGWLADKIGWRLYVYISLVCAAPLVTFFRNEIIPFCIGIGLLQSGIPATTAMLIYSAGGKTERGISLSFGAAIVAGSVIFILPAGFLADQFLLPTVVIFIMLVLLAFNQTHSKGVV
jgi:MFS family permease